jgi:hypothetical protein
MPISRETNVPKGKCFATSVRKASQRLTQLDDDALAPVAASRSDEIVACVSNTSPLSPRHQLLSMQGSDVVDVSYTIRGRQSPPLTDVWSGNKTW